MTSEDTSAKKVTVRKSTGAAASPDVLETMYIHVDGVNTSANWRLNDYEEKGALSEADQATLARQFGLPPDLLVRLSIYVGNSLDIESLVNLTKVKRDVAITRANKRLEEGARLAKRVEQDLASIFSLVELLSHAYASDSAQKAALASAKERVDIARTSATGLYSAIDRLLRLPGSAAEISPTDKRRIWDGGASMS